MSLKHFFFRNYKAKISLFLVAVFLWAFIMIGAEYDTTFDIPLEIMGRKPGKVLVESVPKTIKIQCKDTGKQLLMFQFFSDAALRLDISSINYFYDYPIQQDQIQLPGGFYPKVMTIVEPDTVKIRLDDVEHKRVPILSRVAVIPKAGHILLEAPMLGSDSLSIRGARRHVRTLREVYTDSIVFEGVSGDFRVMVPLKMHPDGLEYSINRVEVTAKVDLLGQIVIDDVPIVLDAIPADRQVIAEPSVVAITVKGAVSLLKDLRSDSVRAVINFSRVWTPDKKTYQPEIALPAGVELIAITPGRVQLNVKKTG